MKIAVAGGTGFVGRALVAALAARGDEVTLLSRDPKAAMAGARTVVWDGKSAGEWAAALNGLDALVNLAGESIAAKRWTAERKLVLSKSRLDAARALVAALSQGAKPPKTFLSASAVGYYGTSPEGDLAENAPQGRDFLAALCGQWEREAYAAEPLGARVATLRLGVVLGADGGALSKMLLPFKLFAGGPLGSGKQPFPWVHRDDAVGAILFLLGHDKLSGPVNVTSPDPRTNAEFSKALGQALRRPSWAPAPAFALKAALGEMADMLLGGQRALPAKLLEAGYSFKYPALEAALASLKLR